MKGPLVSPESPKTSSDATHAQWCLAVNRKSGRSGIGQSLALPFVARSGCFNCVDGNIVQKLKVKKYKNTKIKAFKNKRLIPLK